MSSIYIKKKSILIRVLRLDTLEVSCFEVDYLPNKFYISSTHIFCDVSPYRLKKKQLLLMWIGLTQISRNFDERTFTTPITHLNRSFLKKIMKRSSFYCRCGVQHRWQISVNTALKHYLSHWLDIGDLKLFCYQIFTDSCQSYLLAESWLTHCLRLVLCCFL